MFTTNFRNIVGSQILALSSFGAGMGLAPSDAHGQERIFGFLFKLDNNFTANLAPEHDSLVARRFIREIDPSGDLLAQFDSALKERTILQINSGSFERLDLPTRCEVALTDGSFIRFERSEISDFKITKDSRLKLSDLTIPASAISNIRFNPSVKYDLDWQRLLAEGNKLEDLIAIRRPHGKLDTLGGLVRSLSSEEIEFKVDNETYRVPYSKIEGIILASAGKQKLGGELQAVLETASHTLRCCKVSLGDSADAHLNIETASGALATIPLSEPLRLDRSKTLSITLSDMAISHSRVPRFSDYSLALPKSDKPLTLAAKPYSISGGSGIWSSLSVSGGVSVEIRIPDGKHSLHFSPKFGKYSASSFTLRYASDKSSANLEYTQKRFPSGDEVLDLRNEPLLNGPGTLTIQSGEPGNELTFETFLLIPN